jgi:hypothetical protein
MRQVLRRRLAQTFDAGVWRWRQRNRPTRLKSPGAREAFGASRHSRLLNLFDGVMGQGFRVMVLLIQPAATGSIRDRPAGAM